ncbi:MAG: aspartate aminotransferase family protein, partial [Cyclobacteriaceae bacterium]
MKLYDVYPLFDVEPVSGKDCYVYDQNQQPYLDFYGGHAVISIGHSHPHYVNRLSHQLSQIGFYSNSIVNRLQKDLAEKLGQLSGYEDYHLFLCNSGAEANENALKLASFHTGKNQVIAFKDSFHGRTNGALAITDNTSLRAPINSGSAAHFLEMEDIEGLEKLLKTNQIAAVVIEGIQGIGGINVPSESFLQEVEALCQKYQASFILDEIQSGYGRTGQFFAHQNAQVKP